MGPVAPPTLTTAPARDAPAPVTERWRQPLRVVAVCLLLGNLAAQVTRGVWNMAAGAGTSTDWVPFAAASRLAAYGSSCLYYARCIVSSEAAYLGPALSTGAARQLGATTLPSGAAYSPFLNPPPAAALLEPLAVMPPTVGFLLFALISVGAIAAAGRLLITRFGCPPFATALAVLAVPGVLGLALGQWDALLTLALVVALWAAHRHPLLAGVALSALIIKPQCLWLVPVALLVLRNFRVMLGLVGALLLWAVASLAMVGPAEFAAWISALASAGSSQLRMSLGLPGLVASAAGVDAAYAASAVGAVLVVAAAVRFRDRLRAWPELTVALSVCLSLVLAPHVLCPDFVLLAPALALSARRCPRLSIAASALLSIAFLSDLSLSTPSVILGVLAIVVAIMVSVWTLVQGEGASRSAPRAAAALNAAS